MRCRPARLPIPKPHLRAKQNLQTPSCSAGCTRAELSERADSETPRRLLHAEYVLRRTRFAEQLSEHAVRRDVAKLLLRLFTLVRLCFQRRTYLQPPLIAGFVYRTQVVRFHLVSHRRLAARHVFAARTHGSLVRYLVGAVRLLPVSFAFFPVLRPDNQPNERL
jgi:hypothetical protein